MRLSACIFVAFIDDPALGHDAISSFCPQSLAFVDSQMSEQHLNAFKQRSLSLGLTKSLLFLGLTPTNYSQIRSSLFAHGINVTQGDFDRFAQWYDKDPVRMTQRAAKEAASALAGIARDLKTDMDGLNTDMDELNSIQVSEASQITSYLAPVSGWLRADMAEIRDVTASLVYDGTYSGSSYAELEAATDAVLLEKQDLAEQDIQGAIDGVEGMKAVADDIQAVTLAIQTVTQNTQQVIVQPGFKMEHITRAAMLRTIGEVADRLSAAAAAAEQAMFNAVGLFSGLKAAQKIFPFAISVLTGTIKGLEEYRSLVMSTQYLTNDRDVRILHIWTRMLILVCISTLVVPLMAAPIFIYQFIATYAFAMVIVGLALVLGGTAASVFQGEESQKKLSLFKVGGAPLALQLTVLSGYALILGGVVLELWTTSIGYALRIMLTPLQAVSVLLGMLFSMFLTKVVTTSVAVNSSEFFFRQFAGVIYVSEADGTQVQSQLSKMTVNGSGSRGGQEKKASLGRERV